MNLTAKVIARELMHLRIGKLGKLSRRRGLQCSARSKPAYRYKVKGECVVCGALVSNTAVGCK